MCSSYFSCPGFGRGRAVILHQIAPPPSPPFPFSGLPVLLFPPRSYGTLGKVQLVSHDPVQSWHRGKCIQQAKRWRVIINTLPCISLSGGSPPGLSTHSWTRGAGWAGTHGTQGEWEETEEESDVRLAVEGEVNRMMGGEERCTAEVLETSHQPESFRKGPQIFTFLDLICWICAPNSIIHYSSKNQVGLNQLFNWIFNAQQPKKGYATATAKSRNSLQQQQMRTGLITMAAVELWRNKLPIWTCIHTHTNSSLQLASHSLLCTKLHKCCESFRGSIKSNHYRRLGMSLSRVPAFSLHIHFPYKEKKSKKCSNPPGIFVAGLISADGLWIQHDTVLVANLIRNRMALN